MQCWRRDLHIESPMPLADFIHLRVHTAYSLSAGAIKIKELVAHEAGEGQRPLREPERVVVLVQSQAGYRNLLALVSRSFLDSDAGADPAIALADLAANSDGLLCLTGGANGPVGRLIADGQDVAAGILLDALKAAFPGRLYIELTRHGMPEEARTEAGFVDLAYKHDLPLVATNDAYFPTRDYYEAHDALLCIAQGKVVDDNNRDRLTPDHFF